MKHPPPPPPPAPESEGVGAGLGAGASLVMALGSSLLGYTWHIIALFLAISFVFHILEIQQCLRLAKRLPH